MRMAKDCDRTCWRNSIKRHKQVLLPIVMISDTDFVRTAQIGPQYRYFRFPVQWKLELLVFREGTQCDTPQVNTWFRQTMKMEAEHFSETLVHIFQSTRCHCYEDRKSDCLRVPKSYRIAFIWFLFILCNRSVPTSVHCTDLYFFTFSRTRCTVPSWMLLRLLKIINHSVSGNRLHRVRAAALKDPSINPLNTKRRLFYLKTQFVPRSKHFSSRL